MNIKITGYDHNGNTTSKIEVMNNAVDLVKRYVKCLTLDETFLIEAGTEAEIEIRKSLGEIENIFDEARIVAIVSIREDFIEETIEFFSLREAVKFIGEYIENLIESEEAWD